eukprot:15341063-Ditylum_brightwellii.AAC.1
MRESFTGIYLLLDTLSCNDAFLRLDVKPNDDKTKGQNNQVQNQQNKEDVICQVNSKQEK